MVSPQSMLRSSQPHIHVSGLRCPVCDQPIPNEKADEVRARMETRERDFAEALSTRLKQQFAAERVQIEANARTALEQTRAEAAAALESARAEAEAAAQQRIEAAETAKISAEGEAKALKENHENLLNERLQELREAMEKDKATALSAKDSRHFEENRKLKDKLDEALRKLEQKTAAELGEGAEVDLFEELKDLFDGDRIRRVPKGTPGADIIHEIIENGKVCGKIVYDSKKRNRWATEYATKLCEDKIAEGADHAVLSLLKFPADARQLDVRDGVILANPARVGVIAGMLREFIVRSHSLRLSGQERENKKGELYAYITGERFRQQMDSIEGQTGKLLDVDVAEEKAHRKVWETRGSLLKSLQKAHGNLCADVARIIGTRDAEQV